MMVNAGWHKAHRMPKHPTFEQRLEWHRGHARNCDCRKPPPDIAALLAAESPTGSPPNAVRGPAPKRG